MVEIQEKTSVACILKQGTPPLTFKWIKDNNELFESDNIKIKTMGDVSILTIEPVNSKHSGNYTCFVSNKFGRDKHSSLLVVEGIFYINS